MGSTSAGLLENLTGYLAMFLVGTMIYRFEYSPPFHVAILSLCIFVVTMMLVALILEIRTYVYDSIENQTYYHS